MQTTSEPVPECLACGVCCFSRLDEYVRVSGDDYTRLGDAAEPLTLFAGNRCFMRMVDGHCAALGRSVGGAWVCSVYLDRPETCRVLERGGTSCGGERAAKADRPAALLAQWHA